MSNTVEQLVAALQKGEMVVVSDRDDREDEADLIASAAHMTEEQMAHIIRYTSGIITVPMTQARLDELDLALIQSDNRASFETAFTMSVDFKPTTRGGVSAAERLSTVKALLDPATDPEDLGRPGHVFPLRAHPEGVLARDGHTEASIELMRLAGLPLVAVIGELINDDGSMMRGDTLDSFVKKFGYTSGSVEDIVSYRKAQS